MTIRTQLLVLGLLVFLVLPWAGCSVVRDMEQVLQAGQLQSARITARAAARIAAPYLSAIQADTSRRQPLYLHPVRSPPLIDGFDEDWEPLLRWRERIADGISVVAATDGNDVFLLVEIDREDIAYQRGTGRDPDADHLRLGFGEDAPSTRIATAAPGPVVGRRDSSREIPEPDARIAGNWQETGDGYRVEMRLRTGPGTEGIRLEAWGGGHRLMVRRFEFVAPSTGLSTALRPLVDDDTRIWVIDHRGYALARVGYAARRATPAAPSITGYWLGVLRQSLQGPGAPDTLDRPDSAPAPRGIEVNEALGGRPTAHWYESGDSGTPVVSAAHPSASRGAVIVERSGEALQRATQLALGRISGITLVSLLGISLLVLAYATWLTIRIRRLRDASEAAFRRDIGISHEFPSSGAGDELGDLSRSFASLISELRGYTEYLRGLSARLSHELRTPLAVLRTSLENLDEDTLTPDAMRYVARAREGTGRLTAMLGAMTEARGVEDAVRETEFERFDLAKLVRGCAGGYQEIYPERRIEPVDLAGTCTVVGAPDLIAQMLDKLVDNAVDFSPAGALIEVELWCDSTTAGIAVFNEGEPLPRDIGSRLFESMVSVRRTPTDRPHLGLGLYIVRQIAQRHGGGVKAENQPSRGGVRVDVAIARDYAG
ncbi:MAG: ATP-binding protein [Pseudomonadota bacterium]|nr:ATP-binding protein [Pseudomonadota bacterium]